MLSTNQNARAQRWFWRGGFGLGLITLAIVCVLLNKSGRTPPNDPSLGEIEPMVSTPSSLNTTVKTMVAIQELPTLPILNFPPDSVEAACGLNELPPYWNEISSPRSSELPVLAKERWIVLEFEECRTALETHVSSINPYLWGATYENRQFSFFVLDEPLTFERIFADPVRDFARVQDALSRSECLMEQGTETNWELKETCHAEAFLNYALINRFCFDDGVSKRSRTIYREEDNPTPEQDRFMWKQLLENDWVRMKCQELDSTLESTEKHQELTQLLINLGDYNTVASLDHERAKEVLRMGQSEYLTSQYLIPTLIEMAARFGDDVAGLTQPFTKIYSHQYGEEGYKHGRFTELLTSAEWRKFELKKEPTVERFLETFQMLARLDASRADPRDEIEFDWEWTVRHLCEPPFENFTMKILPEPEFMPPPEPILSCEEVVHKIRQQGISFLPLTLALDKFEQVALELEVYE